MLEELDEWILHKCTQFSHQFQRLTGKTNFFIAKVFLSVVGCSAMVVVVNYWVPLLEHKSTLFSCVLNVVIVLVEASRVKKCQENEDRLYDGLTLNKLVGGGFYWRLIWVWLLIPDSITILFYSKSIFDILSNLFGPAMCGAVYFLAVTPLPPGTSKLGQMIERLRAGFRKQVPVPVSNCTLLTRKSAGCLFYTKALD